MKNNIVFYCISTLLLLLVVDSFAGTRVSPALIFSQYNAARLCPKYCKDHGGWRVGSENEAWGKQGAGFGPQGYCECIN